MWLAERAWFCVDAATCSLTAKWVRNPVNVVFGKIARMLVAVELDVPGNPVDVCLLGSATVMVNSQNFDDAVVKTGRGPIREQAQGRPMLFCWCAHDQSSWQGNFTNHSTTPESAGQAAAACRHLPPRRMTAVPSR